MHLEGVGGSLCLSAVDELVRGTVPNDQCYSAVKMQPNSPMPAAAAAQS